MRPDKKTMEAFVRLKPDPRWQRIVAALEAERESIVKTLMLCDGPEASEYRRGILAGMGRMAEELLTYARADEAALAKYEER